MKERPILFSAPMVRAILEGRKTQTRRMVKKLEVGCCPYGQPGDRLWVRETFVIESNRGIEPESIYKPPFDDGRPIRRVDDTPEELYWQQCHYRASDPAPELYYEDSTKEGPECRWKPSIHMPRWASRINLEITGVRVERLQDISIADALSEGLEECLDLPSRKNNPVCAATAIQLFRELWESINGPGSWDVNPWVWAIKFKQIYRSPVGLCLRLCENCKYFDDSEEGWKVCDRPNYPPGYKWNLDCGIQRYYDQENDELCNGKYWIPK